MNTTPAGRSRESLAAALASSREYTLSLYAHLDLAQQRFPQIPVVNLPRWELGHIGWFQEFWCRRYRSDDRDGRRTPSRIADADAWWNSRDVPHATRWTLPLPSWPAIHDYLARTLADTQDDLARRDDGDTYFHELALLHEDMHGEALLMTLQTLALPAPPTLPPPPAATGAATAPPAGDCVVAGGEWLLGAARDDVDARFVFDNEKWAHRVSISPFAIARRCVSEAEFADFVAAGGYRRRELWTDEGARWLDGCGRDAPAYWRRGADGWELRRFDRWRPLQPDLPVVHVNRHEANAWCRLHGRRLPTEGEWDFAARAVAETLPGRTTQDAVNLDVVHGGPLPLPAEAGTGPRPQRMLGDVWEWTASAFAPFPGFAPDPYAEYSQPWFGDHAVIRGGAWTTRSRLVHPGFRNFYLPSRHDPFVGFRSCARAVRI
jgi:iron(II)-dependent oxidoreductase